MTETMVHILSRHFPDGEFPQTPGRIQLMLAVGLMEAALSQQQQPHEGALEDLRALAQRIGLAETSPHDPLFAHMRFLYERTLTVEHTKVAGLELPLTSAQLLLARGSGSGQHELDTIFAATLLSREEERWRFTTTFISSDRFITDPMQPFEDPLHSNLRPYVSGTFTAAPFAVTIDEEATSINGIGALQIMMRRANVGQWPRRPLNPDGLRPETVAKAWLQHFVVDTPQGGSTYFAHFPRPGKPLLVLR